MGGAGGEGPGHALSWQPPQEGHGGKSSQCGQACPPCSPRCSDCTRLGTGKPRFTLLSALRFGYSSQQIRKILFRLIRSGLRGKATGRPSLLTWPFVHPKWQVWVWSCRRKTLRHWKGFYIWPCFFPSINEEFGNLKLCPKWKTKTQTHEQNATHHSSNL